MPRILRAAVAVVALLLALLVGPALAGAAPAPPPTLTGETFTSPNLPGSVTCTNSGSFTYTVSGTATGPYPGTFTETGSATVDNLTNKVTAFTATFAIDSPAGQVTGTKTIAAPAGLLACYSDGGNAGFINLPTTYTASIQTPTGRYTDSGTSLVQGLLLYQGTVIAFAETYASAQPATIPVAPTSADQCMGGGHAGFIDPSTGQPFANQGRCVQFVYTGK